MAPTGDANCRAGARRIRNFARALGVGLLFLALPGCYSSHTRMPDRLQTLAVPVFANRTYLDDYTRRLEVEVSDSVRQTFLQTSRLKLVGRETADLVLEGDILKLARTALRVDRYGDPAEVKLQITGRISLYDVKEAKYVFRNLVVSNDLARPSSGTYNLRRGESEDQGRRRAVEDLARNIVRAVLDHW